MSRPVKIRLISLVIVLALWEFYGRRVNPILFTYPLAIMSRLFWPCHFR